MIPTGVAVCHIPVAFKICSVFNEYSPTSGFIHSSWCLNEYPCLNIPNTVTFDLVIITEMIKIAPMSVELI